MLEAMQERSVSVGGETRKLPDPFLVLATQNPIEQEGTYTLPEAQLDRFLFKVTVPYAVRSELAEILKRTTTQHEAIVEPVLDGEDVLAARRTCTPSGDGAGCAGLCGSACTGNASRWRICP